LYRIGLATAAALEHGRKVIPRHSTFNGIHRPEPPYGSRMALLIPEMRSSEWINQFLAQ
jgi:hypothetical protein